MWDHKEEALEGLAAVIWSVLSWSIRAVFWSLSCFRAAQAAVTQLWKTPSVTAECRTALSVSSDTRFDATSSSWLLVPSVPAPTQRHHVRRLRLRLRLNPSACFLLPSYCRGQVWVDFLTCSDCEPRFLSFLRWHSHHSTVEQNQSTNLNQLKKMKRPAWILAHTDIGFTFAFHTIGFCDPHDSRVLIAQGSATCYPATFCMLRMLDLTADTTKILVLMISSSHELYYYTTD